MKFKKGSYQLIGKNLVNEFSTSLPYDQLSFSETCLAAMVKSIKTNKPHYVVGTASGWRILGEVTAACRNGYYEIFGYIITAYSRA
jgi:hypothetical protein